MKNLVALIASLIILVMLPGATSSTRHKYQTAAPLSATAYADPTRPNWLTDCSCQVGTDGISRDCNGTLCPENGSAIKTENNSADRDMSATGSGSLSVWAQALISVVAILAWS